MNSVYSPPDCEPLLADSIRRGKLLPILGLVVYTLPILGSCYFYYEMLPKMFTINDPQIVEEGWQIIFRFQWYLGLSCILGFVGLLVSIVFKVNQETWFYRQVTIVSLIGAILLIPFGLLFGVILILLCRRYKAKAVNG